MELLVSVNRQKHKNLEDGEDPRKKIQLLVVQGHLHLLLDGFVFKINV